MRKRLDLIPLIDLMFAGVGIFLVLFALISLQSPRSQQAGRVDLFLLLEGDGNWVRAVTADRQEVRLPRFQAAPWVAERARAQQRALAVVIGIPAAAVRAARSLTADLRALGRVADAEAAADTQAPLRLELLQQAMGSGPDAGAALLAGWMGD